MNLRSWATPLIDLIAKEKIPSASFPSEPPPRQFVSRASEVDLGGKAIEVTLIEVMANRDEHGFFINPRTGEREPVYLHSSLNATDFDYENLPKWHILYCNTLQTYYNEGKIDKYAIKDDDKDEQFLITSAHNGRPYIRSLRACKHCLRQLRQQDGQFRDARSYSYSNFKLELGKTAAPQRTAGIPKYSDAKKNFYTHDWPQVSAKRIAQENGRCQDCKSRFSLQVHHVNEQKNDNRKENLRVLCVGCHQKYHKHRIRGF